MGVCQTVGGASTSGQGISGAQIAHAVRTGAALREENDSGTPNHSFESISPKAFSVVATHEATLPDDGGVLVKVSSYAPRVFQYLRTLEGIDDAQFVVEWDLPPEKCEMKLGEGRSMALFLRSTNLDFMCKTISEVEVQVLLDILPKYTQHLRTYQNSLLMRYLMLLKIEIGANVGYVVCFGDIFSTCSHLNERWDIKGRVPKPGKYRHFPRHQSSDQHHGCTFAGEQSAFEAEATNEAEGIERMASTIAAQAGELDCSEPFSPSALGLITRKDKDLSRLFWLPEKQRVDLIAQLHLDYGFLCACSLMDYSILIGVKYEKLTNCSLRRRTMVGENGRECEKRPTKRGSSFQHVSRCEFHKGILSVGGEETYYVGIIDMLTIYNVKKKSANFFKTFLWQPETLSTIPPEAYRQRITDFTTLLFPPLDPAKRLPGFP